VHRSIEWGVLAVLAPLAVGCAATRQAPSVAPSGFLGTAASLLSRGTGDEPKLYYRNPDISWKTYDEILLDPVTIWKNPGTQGVSQADAQALADNFHNLLYQSLSKDWEMAAVPRPGTLRLQAALTQLDGTDVVLNVVSTAVPQLRAVTGLEGYATGEPLFTGEAGMAFKVTDSATGRLMSEGVDGRVGEKHLMDSWKKWSDVDDSLRYWAEMFRYDFCRNRGRTNCVKPRAEKTF